MAEHRMEALLNLVYANHARSIMNERHCTVDETFKHMDDIAVIRDFIKELINCDCPRGVRNAYVSQICNAEWRVNGLKTNIWREKICKMVTSMNRVEDWFLKTL